MYKASVFVLVALAALTFTVSAGCGSKDTIKTVEVSGKVTIDGQPIERGVITFVAANGDTPTAGGTIENGQYKATIPPGEKIVLVLGNKLVGKEPEYEGVPDSPMRDKYERITPEAYNVAHVSPLRANVTGPQQDLNFDLSSSFK